MGFGRKFAYSFFDFAAYKNFLVQGFRTSILYIFLVTLIFSTLTSINAISTLNSDISSVEENLASSAPKFELKDGSFSVDSSEPIYYKDTNNFLFPLLVSNLEFINILHNSSINNNINEGVNSENSVSLPNFSIDDSSYYMLIVDTNKKTNSSILNSYSNGIYIDKTSLSFRNNYQTIGTINFSDYNKLDVTNQTVYKALFALKILLPLINLVFIPIFSFIGNLFSGFLILAPLCLFIGPALGVKLSYSKACTLSFYAMTLPLLLETLLTISGLMPFGFTIIFYVISLLYCALAIKKIKDIDKSNLKLTH
jgi:hypothetical protein